MKISKEQLLKALSTFTLPGGGKDLVSTNAIVISKSLVQRFLLDIVIDNNTSIQKESRGRLY